MATTFEQLVHLSRAGASVIQLVSYEWERVRGLVVGLGKRLSIPLFVWSRIERAGTSD